MNRVSAPSETGSFPIESICTDMVAEMSAPQFSILIPSKGRPELLRYAVDSVLKQLKGGVTVEIVIADNASQPSYESYVSSLGDIAVNSIRSEQPLSVTENWNQCLAQARGEYIIMLGDDDAIAPGWLEHAARLIQEFDKPDALYAMAYHYGYPNAVPFKMEGYLASVNNSRLFDAHDEPYLLAQSEAQRIGLQMMKFRHLFSFNSQHFIWKRDFVESLAELGSFFQSPYPDYYSSTVTMLRASTLLVVPSPKMIIGISPKSFGFYLNNDQSAAGYLMLANASSFGDVSPEARAAYEMPGADHLRYWLVAAVRVARVMNLDVEKVVDIRRFRRLQIMNSFSDGSRPIGEIFREFLPYLNKNEVSLARQLVRMEKVKRRLDPKNTGRANFVGRLGGIYADNKVEFLPLGPHKSISDAWEWLAMQQCDATAEDLTKVSHEAGEVLLEEGLDAISGEEQAVESEGEPKKIAVVYLARSGDGKIDEFIPFIESYRKFSAGIDHDLIIIRKGMKGYSGALEALRRLMEGIEYKTFDVSDDGFDIQAYLKVAPQLSNERVCFLNTYSEIRSENWLRKLSDQLDEPGVGMVGATASYESLRESLKLISKAVWLTEIKKIKYNKKLAKQFKPQLQSMSPTWWAKYKTFSKRVRGYFRRLPGGAKVDAGFENHWNAVTANDGHHPLHILRKFKQFPNPHIRSTAFMINRELLLSFGIELDNSKYACVDFESGPGGLPTRLAQRGLSLVLVGDDGCGYAVEDWPKSNSFRLGDQSNVLVLDNQVRNYANMSAPQKQLHQRLSWGDYLAAEPKNFVNLGFEFKKGELNLLKDEKYVRQFTEDEQASSSEEASDTPASVDPAPTMDDVVGIEALESVDQECEAPEIEEEETSPFYSLVIPTHNRLSLLRDAVDTILRQTSDDWECVVFDNCSEDPICEYVESLEDPRVKYFRSDEFLPVTDSWNTAIDLAQGRYVSLVGDDDGLAPNFIERLEKIVSEFKQPDFVYASIYQFFHPNVAPWEKSGYVTHLKDAFFWGDFKEPFLLNSSAARAAVSGSLRLKRNFTFNMQAFVFRRSFLERLRKDGRIFHSPFPDYYLANVAMARGANIVAVPEALVIAGVSRASFGFTLFNNEEARGAALLNTQLQGDPLFKACSRQLLPGPKYNTNYVLTMMHVVANLADLAPAKVNFTKYRRIQIRKLLGDTGSLDKLDSSIRKELWKVLISGDTGWVIRFLFYRWCAGFGGRSWQKRYRKLVERTAEMTGYVAVMESRVVGRFATLPEFYTALEDGTYP